MPRASARRSRTASSSRSMPVSTSSATARWASRASSPTRRSASTAWRSARATRPSPFSNTRETRDFPEYYQSAGRRTGSARRRRALMVCAGPIKYKGHAQLKADLDTLKAALKGVNATEAFVPAIAPSNIETHYAERILSVRRGVCVRHRRGDARGIQGDRRRRLPAADRRSVPGHLLHHQARAEHRGVPQMGRAAGRGAQSRACRHPGGPRAVPHLLQHQHGAAHPRHAAQGHHRHHPQGARRRLLVRGGEPAPRARMGGVEARQAAGRQDAACPASSPNRPCWSSIPSWWRSASSASPASSAASASSPAPTAASPRSPDRTRCIPSIVWAKFKALVDGAKLASGQLWKQR